MLLSGIPSTCTIIEYETKHQEKNKICLGHVNERAVTGVKALLENTELFCA